MTCYCISQAIDTYVNDRVSQLKSLRGDDALQDQVRRVLHQKANGTFLWVALVLKELEQAASWDIEQVLEDVPAGLDELYARMLKYIGELKGKGSQDFCWRVLSAATLAYRPLQLLELGVVAGLPDAHFRNTNKVQEIVSMCGSFLAVRDQQVFIIHQSAKDYLVSKAGATIFPSGRAQIHRGILLQSLEAMRQTLRHDIYDLSHPGSPGPTAPRSPNPLDSMHYSCVYWVDHLDASMRGGLGRDDPQDDGTIYGFLNNKYLHWLEAVSLLGSLSEGITAISKLHILLVSHTANPSPNTIVLSAL